MTRICSTLLSEPRYLAPRGSLPESKTARLEFGMQLIEIDRANLKDEGNHRCGRLGERTCLLGHNVPVDK